VFLFQLQCALGSGTRPYTQLQLLESLNDETMLLAQIFGPVINCEMLRPESLRQAHPIIFGEPMEWVGLLVKANELSPASNRSRSGVARPAFEAAPATPGTMDGKPFEWISDGDSRLGPLLEVILKDATSGSRSGRIKRVTSSAGRPARLVWAPAQFVWTNGGEPQATFLDVIPRRKNQPTARPPRPQDRLGRPRRAASASVWANGSGHRYGDHP